MFTKERVKEELNKDKLTTAVSLLTALFFGFALVFGEALDTDGELPIRSGSAWLSLLLTAGLCFCVLFSFLCFIRQTKSENINLPKDDVPGILKKWAALDCFFGWWLAFMVCWLPVLLAVYPGFFLYDAYEEYMEVATGLFTTHHPLLHVLLLGKTVDTVHRITGSYNYGIVLYITVQMMILAACFAYLIQYLKREQISKTVRLLVFLYFAFFPVNVMFVLCSVKDTLFAAAIFMAVLLMKKYGCETLSLPKKLGIGATLLLALLLRNNMLYALLVWAVFLGLLVFATKKDRKAGRKTLQQLILFLAILILVFEGISFGLVKHTNAKKGSAGELLTVPIQQIARGYRANPDMYNEDEKELLFSYIPEKALNRYTPNLADPVKVSFESDVYRNSAKGFWKLWFKGLLHNPVGYVNAWCMTSYGFWYPDATVNVYEGHSVFTHDYEKSSYFGFETEKPGIRQSMWPWLEKIYHDIALEGTVQRRPVLSWFFSMGALTFVYLICINVVLAKKQYKKLIPYVLPMLVWLTFLLGPTFLPRYMVFEWFLLPVFLVDTFAHKQATTKCES